MRNKRKLVHGVGINDADYAVQPTIDGRQVRCKIYNTWTNMLERCYSEKCQARRPTYKGCSVTPAWLLFSNFRKWMARQDWEGNHLDKDLLFVGNKTYSPETCVFVMAQVNTFTVDHGPSRGKYLLGACWHDPAGKFMAYCNNPFTKKQETIGLFASEQEAHQAWKKRKHELACQLADSEYVTDGRVATALKERYALL